MDMDEIMTSRTNSHQIRLGMDYSLTKNHLLSLVYTTAFTDSKHYSTGAQNSVTDSQGDSQLHNAKLDYQTPFGLKAGVGQLHPIILPAANYYIARWEQRQ